MSVMECYKSIDFYRANKILENNEIGFSEYSFIIEGNNAFVYRIDQSYLVVPNNFLVDSECLYFEDYNCLYKFIETDEWPVDDVNGITFLKEKEFIMTFDGNIVLQDILGINQSVLDSEVLDEQEMNSVFNSLKIDYDNYNEIDKLKSIIGLGEVFKIRNNCDWILIKEYSDFNHYWVPALKLSNDSVLLVFDFFKSFFKVRSQSISALFNMPWVKNPPTNLKEINSWRYQCSE